jgi:hypothetical protein
MCCQSALAVLKTGSGGIPRANQCMAVSYPGVGRFRRAETGILGRAIKGSPIGTPFFIVPSDFLQRR